MLALSHPSSDLEHRPLVADLGAVKHTAILVLVSQLHWICAVLPDTSDKRNSIRF